MAVGRSRKARADLRRKRRLERMVHDLTDRQWDALKDAWAGCAYCGATSASLQRDCVLPISRGGRYTLDNVVPACRSCNTSKCNDEVTSWLRRKRLDERSFLLRHLEIRTTLTLSMSCAPQREMPTPTTSPALGGHPHGSSSEVAEAGGSGERTAFGSGVDGT